MKMSQPLRGTVWKFCKKVTYTCDAIQQFGPRDLEAYIPAKFANNVHRTACKRAKTRNSADLRALVNG